VRFLNNSAAQEVVWALGLRAQGDLISADVY
jgi:hypothetical protein